MKNNCILLITLSAVLIMGIGCVDRSSEVEKHQYKRDNIVDAHSDVKEIILDSILINRYPGIYLLNNYFIIRDHISYDNQIHIFDRKNYKYLKSTAPKGRGPHEIINIGHIGLDKSKGNIYVSDHGKQKIFSYNLDSLLNDPSYLPSVKLTMQQNQFPSQYTYVSDTLCWALIIEPIGVNNFKPSVGKWNMNTGDISLMPYTYPEIAKKRVVFGVSPEHKLYVEAYIYHDLMIICDLNGNLKHTVFGPTWDSAPSNKTLHFERILFYKDYILALYNGNANTQESFPSKFLVFDLNGDYIKTIETGHAINDCCYDEVNDRLILSLNDEMQFGYLENLSSYVK